ncbi:hypothetical protein Lal_00005071 [Lupinus albus]|nr:hypothetical protein Lal_00005071 [Lupinus albus]
MDWPVMPVGNRLRRPLGCRFPPNDGRPGRGRQSVLTRTRCHPLAALQGWRVTLCVPGSGLVPGGICSSNVARIAGVNIPAQKRVEIGLTYIHGIGPFKAKEICAKLEIPAERRVNELTDDEVLKIRETIDADYRVEGDLRREVAMNIKRLMDLGCYRGLRHRKGLPVRGQRTHTNARTRKGPAKPIAGKKK